MFLMRFRVLGRYTKPSFSHYSSPTISLFTSAKDGNVSSPTISLFTSAKDGNVSSPTISLFTSAKDGNVSSPENHSKLQQFSIDESHIMNQLSEILPISGIPSIQQQLGASSRRRRAVVDEFLQPEDKLRGVFLQKFPSKNAIKCALTSADVKLTCEILAKVVNRGNLSGESMVIFFNWAVEQPNVSKDLESYHVILKALGRRKYFRHMMEMFLDMKKQGINPTSCTLLIVMDSFIRARRVSSAIRLFHSLEDFGLDCGTETFNVLLSCLCCRSHLGTANSLLVKMKGKVLFNSMTYNLIIGGWSRFGRVNEVEKNLEAMVENGEIPDSLTYSYILEVLGRAERIDDAVKTFRKLDEIGFSLDVEVYNAMISNFTSVGNIDEGLIYYKQMLSNNNNCNPNMDTYIRLISAMLKARRVADALELFDEMLNSGIVPSTGMVTSFVDTLCGYGPPHAALMIYKKARKVGCKISITTYKLLLKRLSRFGKCGIMLNIWSEMQESGCSSDMEVYEYIIFGLCNNGQLEDAVLVMEESLQKGFCPSRLICSILNNKLLASKKVEIAYRLHLKIKVARKNENARTYWRAKGWHF